MTVPTDAPKLVRLLNQLESLSDIVVPVVSDGVLTPDVQWPDVFKRRYELMTESDERASHLVWLDPDDEIVIPAFRAALERVISTDFAAIHLKEARIADDGTITSVKYCCRIAVERTLALECAKETLARGYPEIKYAAKVAQSGHRVCRSDEVCYLWNQHDKQATRIIN